MPTILIALVIGAVVAMAAAVFAWRTYRDNPELRANSNGTPLMLLGIAFLGMSVLYALVLDLPMWYLAPIGIVFLGVGAKQRRDWRQRHLR